MSSNHFSLACAISVLAVLRISLLRMSNYIMHNNIIKKSDKVAGTQYAVGDYYYYCSTLFSLIYSLYNIYIIVKQVSSCAHCVASRLLTVLLAISCISACQTALVCDCLQLTSLW